MGLNWHIPLPGPFSISGPVVPRIKVPSSSTRPAPCRRPCCAPRTEPSLPQAPRGLTAGQAARLKAKAEARERGEGASPVLAWTGVVVLSLAMLGLFVAMLFG